MKKIEQKPEKTVYSKKVEEISFRAADMKEFQEAVKQAKDKLEAIRKVRELLRQHFPEISEIPEPTKPKISPIRRPILPWAPSNEFIIAKNIVDLLYEK